MYENPKNILMIKFFRRDKKLEPLKRRASMVDMIWSG